MIAKKSFFLLLTFFVLTSFVNAQTGQKPKNNSIYFNIGLSIPNGSDAYRSGGYIPSANDFNSYTNKGFIIELGYQYSIKNIGLTTSVREQNWYCPEWGNSFNSISFLVAMNYSFKITEKISISPKAMGGISSIYSPRNILSHGPDPSAQDATPTSSISLNKAVGIIFKYQFTEKIGLLLNGDYSFAKPTFKYPANAQSITESINSLNFTTGITYRF